MGLGRDDRLEGVLGIVLEFMEISVEVSDGTDFPFDGPSLQALHVSFGQISADRLLAGIRLRGLGFLQEEEVGSDVMSICIRRLFGITEYLDQIEEKIIEILVGAPNDDVFS